MRIIAALFVLAALACAKSPSSLLVGTWRSDEAETLAGLGRFERLPAGTRALLEDDFFGELEVTYHRDGTVVTRLGGHESTGSYEIVDEGPNWVDVRGHDELADRAVVRRLWIEGDRLWLVVGGSKLRFVEYFERI